MTWLATRSATNTGALVSAGVAAAGVIAWFVTPMADDMHHAPPVAAAVDAARLPAGLDAAWLEQGRGRYAELCLPCHGAHGDGRGPWAYRVTPRPADLTRNVTQARSDAELFAIVSEPRPGTPMIGWKHHLSETERRQLVGYMRHLGGARETRHRH